MTNPVKQLTGFFLPFYPSLRVILSENDLFLWYLMMN